MSLSIRSYYLWDGSPHWEPQASASVSLYCADWWRWPPGPSKVNFVFLTLCILYRPILNKAFQFGKTSPKDTHGKVVFLPGCHIAEYYTQMFDILSWLQIAVKTNNSWLLPLPISVARYPTCFPPCFLLLPATVALFVYFSKCLVFAHFRIFACTLFLPLQPRLAASCFFKS